MTVFNQYYSVPQPDHVKISARQGSDFAKQVANDFNPIHDVESKRFCVPGDLLFAIALTRYGLYQKMKFSFKELIRADSVLNFTDLSDSLESGVVLNERDKVVAEIEARGACLRDDNVITPMVERYVAFSGMNFPHILVPLMREHRVMVNPQRPLVIYENMSFEFTHFDVSKAIDIRLKETRLDVVGKRGNADLSFEIHDNGAKVGEGSKRLVLSGLREYDERVINMLCEQYNERAKAG